MFLTIIGETRKGNVNGEVRSETGGIEIEPRMLMFSIILSLNK